MQSYRGKSVFGTTHCSYTKDKFCLLCQWQLAFFVHKYTEVSRKIPRRISGVKRMKLRNLACRMPLVNIRSNFVNKLNNQRSQISIWFLLVSQKSKKFIHLKSFSFLVLYEILSIPYLPPQVIMSHVSSPTFCEVIYIFLAKVCDFTCLFRKPRFPSCC